MELDLIYFGIFQIQLIHLYIKYLDIGFLGVLLIRFPSTNTTLIARRKFASSLNLTFS